MKAGGSEAGTEPGQALVLASDELIPGRDVPVKAGKSSCVAGAEEPSILHGEFFPASSARPGDPASGVPLPNSFFSNELREFEVKCDF